MSFPDCIWVQPLAGFCTKMSALRVKLALRKQQPVPERLGGPELMGAPRPPNSRRKAVPTITDLKLKIRRRKVPVPSSCETTLSLEPLTLEPIVTRQTRKPSLKRKQVFAWTSSSGSQEETAPKRPKPRKKRMKKRKRKKPKAQVAARVLTPAEFNVFF